MYKRISKEDISTPKIWFEKIINSIIIWNNRISRFWNESYDCKVLNKIIQKLFIFKLIFIENDGKRNINEFLNILKHLNIISFYGILVCVIMEYRKLGNIKSFMKNKLKRDYLQNHLYTILLFNFSIIKRIILLS